MQLDHIFDKLDIQTKPFALCEIHGVCNVVLPPDAAVTVHYTLVGEGEVVMAGRPPIPIKKGSLVLVPSLMRHEVRNLGGPATPHPECRPAELDLKRVLAAASGAGVEDGQLLTLCAQLNIGLSGTENLVELVREPLSLETSEQSALHQSVTNLLGELIQPGLGSKAMIRALMLQLVIDMIRRRIAEGDGALRWMAALRDPLIWRALQQMMDNPGDRHSVESLADLSGMSRSAFARRFAEAYGSGPMELLRELRMRKAGALLTNSDLPVKRIAERVGFTSRSAFSRQFEATTGYSPRAFRQMSQVA